MFEKRYKEEFDRVHLSPAADERILAAIRQEEQKSRRRYRMRIRIIAAAACVTLVLGIALAFPRPGIPKVESNRVELPIATPAAVTTYRDIFQLVSALEIQSGQDNWGVTDDAIVNESETVGTQAAPGAPLEDSESDTGFTGTNTQYADVDEADIIKTDGQYIYSLRLQEKEITIVKAQGDQTSVVGRIDLIDTAYYSHMYYVDERLVVLYSEGHGYYYGDACVDSYVPRSYTCVTRAAVYDVSDRTAPRLLTTLGQDGTLVDSRVVDGTLYLVSNHSLYVEPKEEDKSTYVPSLYRDDTSAPVAEQHLCIAQDPDKRNYAVITAMRVTGEVERLSEKAVFGGATNLVYANKGHMLLATPHYWWTTTEVSLGNGKVQQDRESNYTTSLSLFSIADGEIAPVANAVIDGELDGQFAIDEYNGYFRLAVTRTHSTNRDIILRLPTYDRWLDGDSDFKQDNALYVLDGKLKEVGRVDDLAPDEQVKSVRFEGDIGYVVTFRQTDPLFAIDLSDPSAPKVLSALKITGFSEYLHPWSDNRLLGFGHAGTEEGINGRLKLTMFNTQNKKDVTVQTALELRQVYYSEGLYDHHAILVDTERGVVGFPVETALGAGYQLYTYNDNEAFELVTDCRLEDYYYSIRGMFIDDCFYVCHKDGVVVYDATYTELLKIDF